MAAIAQIAVICTVVENKVVEGTSEDGNEYKFNKLTVLAGNGLHWDHVGARKGADKNTISVFAKAKKGDTLKLTGCFLNVFTTSSGKACVDILAKNAEIVK
jgi:hypothetical protein